MQSENIGGYWTESDKESPPDTDANGESPQQNDTEPEVLSHLQDLPNHGPGSDWYRIDSIPRTTAAEEGVLWMQYIKWRHMQRIPGARITLNHGAHASSIVLRGCNLKCVISHIIEEVSDSYHLLTLLRRYVGPDKPGDTVTQGAENDPNVEAVLWFLSQHLNTKDDNRIQQGESEHMCLRLDDLLGVMLRRTLNNIAFRKGSLDLVDKIANAINTEPTYVRDKLSRLAVSVELVPRSLLNLLDGKTPVRELSNLIESISADSFREFVLNGYLPFVLNVRSEGEKAFSRIIESHLWLAVDIAKKYCTESVLGMRLDDFIPEGYPIFIEAADDEDIGLPPGDIPRTHNVGLIVAEEINDLGLPLDDLIQEGVIGLIIAAEKFEPNQGTRYMSYAGSWVYQRIHRAMEDQARIVRLPAHMIDSFRDLLRVIRQLVEELGREPSYEEIGGRMDLLPEKVEDIMALVHLPVSLYSPLGDDRETSLSDFLEDETFMSPFDTVSSKLLKEQIDKLLTDLKPKEREVIELRFGLKDGHARTLEEVGIQLSVTRERIRQIEGNALKRLRHPARSRWLKGYL